MLYLMLIILLKSVLVSCRNSTMEGRIIGGSLADIRNFPHCAYLSIGCSDYMFACGASILNQMMLLTAAHCVDECTRKFDIAATVGVDDVDKGKIVREVSRFYSHVDYSPQTLQADISLMFLKKAMPLGEYVRRVIIKPSLSFTYFASVAGWGIINDRNDTDTKLRSVSQKYVAPQRCAQLVGPLEKGMLCATSDNAKYNRPAIGDSGSALVMTNHQQAGLVSFSAGATGYIIYTNVSHFYNWIMQKAPYLTCFRRLKT